jgi:group I intron endonuclease
MSQMFFIIYKITNKINNKFYIGAHKTEDLNDGYMGSGKILKRAINKYRIDNFIKEILFQCNSEEKMFQKEKEIITEELIKDKTCYNLKVGGEGGFDYLNKRGLNKWSEGNNPMYGKKHSPESLEKLRVASTGRKHTNETLVKMSLSNKFSLLSNEKLQEEIKNDTLKENLNKLLWEIPIYEIAKIYNVSSGTIHKLIKKLNISKPSKSYWTEQKMIPRERLEKLLWEIPIYEIAKQHGVTRHTIRHWIEAYNISHVPPNSYFRKPKIASPTKVILSRLVWQMSVVKIGKIYNVSNTTVHAWLKKYEIKIPPHSYWSRLKEPNIEELRKLLKHSSIKDIAVKYDVCINTVRKWIKNNIDG